MVKPFNAAIVGDVSPSEIKVVSTIEDVENFRSSASFDSKKRTVYVGTQVGDGKGKEIKIIF